MTTPAGESGSATVYVLAGCLLVGLAAMVPLLEGAVALAGHRAAAAADTAALAGAQSADVGRLTVSTAAVSAELAASGCREAASVARADHAVLTSCEFVPCASGAGSLQIAVSVPVGWAGVPLPRGVTVSARARAGDAACLPKSPP